MNSKGIGNIGVVKAIAALVERGFDVYLPFGDSGKSDLIFIANNKVFKVQVKTSSNVVNGAVTFGLISSTLHRKGGKKHYYSKEEIDFFILYNIERDTLYALKVPYKPTNNKTIRIDKPKNNNTKNISFEEDFLLKDFLDEITRGFGETVSQ